MVLFLKRRIPIVGAVKRKPPIPIVPDFTLHFGRRGALCAVLGLAMLSGSSLGAGAPAHVPGRLALELDVVPASAALPAPVRQWLDLRGLKAAPHFPSALGTAHWEDGLGAWWLVETEPDRDIPALCDSLAALPGVASATPDWVTRVSTTPNDPLFPNQWALHNTGQARSLGGQPVGQPGLDLGMLTAWDLGSESRPPLVAVLDTGVDLNHLEFHDRLMPGFNFLTNLPGAMDDNGHGTSVASLLGALVNNQAGLAGLSRQARILPLKVFNSIGMGSASALANALNYALQLEMDVANFSGGMDQDYGPATTVIRAGRLEGMWTVAAAGNSGAQLLEFPARLDECVAVGAMSPCGEVKSATSCDGETWWASNTGTGLDLLAPGVRLTAATLGGGYRADFNGSSAACAYVSGALALLRTVAVDADLEEIEEAVEDTALDLGLPGWDSSTGHGLPQVDEALMRLVPLRVNNLAIARQGGRVLLTWNPLPFDCSYRVEYRAHSREAFQPLTMVQEPRWLSGPQELARPARQYRVVAQLGNGQASEDR